MSYDVYKAAVLRALPAGPDPDALLEAPPTESFDLNTALTCPGCGNMDALVQEIQDAEIAVCPRCECEFSPRLESVSRKVIRGISERRQRRMKLFMERLPLRPESPNLDQVDYTLFRKIVDRLGSTTIEDPQVSDRLQQIHNRFVDERIEQGATREQAETRWNTQEHHFRAILANPGEDLKRNMRLAGPIHSYTYDPNEVLADVEGEQI